METKLLHKLVSQLNDELEKLRAEFEAYKKEQAVTKSIHPIVQSQISVPSVESIKSELLDTKEVLSILGVCFNTLKQLVKKGLIKRVKINERRVRYPKSSILDFIRTTSN